MKYIFLAVFIAVSLVIVWPPNLFTSLLTMKVPKAPRDL